MIIFCTLYWTQTGVTALSGPDNEWNLIFVWPEIGQAGQSWAWMARGPLQTRCTDGQRFCRMARGGLEDWAGLAVKEARQLIVEVQLVRQLHIFEANCTAAQNTAQ